ncbi:hypothetical protein [Desulforamulus aquiferis]|uniref:SipL SPOCS domain-containing protein n=1 Tax=Desulforamulus aquiferis TaxID=1397668 RepID=A0AAW7ZH84_9FIRM|nr:hypothetical protein [Desulforamulus aquiferis]MDO7788679.1 hypothetical protein [Desulforamulus aquiferis]RYD05333.1 hypothetical protein N752_09820 [Desulforamulus aquiferis]
MNCDKTIKEIKTFVVVFRDTLTKIGEATIPAPIGVDIDPKTGEVNVPLEITPMGDVVLNPIIGKNKLVNEGSLKIMLTFKDLYPGPCPDVRKSISHEVLVPIQSVHKIEEICPEDHIQEKVEIKSIKVKGIPDKSISKFAGRKMNLLIKVTLQVEVIIAREEIICVQVQSK